MIRTSPFLLLLSLLFSGTIKAEQEQVFIPAGNFMMGCSASDKHCEVDEGKPGGVKVFVSGFYIDKHESSVGEYRKCVEAGVCSEPFDYLRSHYCNYDAPGRGNYPLNCVNWKQAYAFCQWRGGRLAYEAEWEKAARGGTTTSHFWGNEPATCNEAVMDPEQPGKPDHVTDGCWRDLSWPRGSFPPNPFGLYDMIGGTSEWVMNWYDKDAYEQIYAKGDTKGPTSGDRKIIKGGSWDEKHWAQRVSNRFAKPVTGNPDLYGSNGIRCVFPVTNL